MSSPHVLILAAGQGKRMRSKQPKVLHSILHRPLVHYVLDVALSCSPRSLSMVVGCGSEQVKRACSSYGEIQFFEQHEQLGTAHAVKMAEPFLRQNPAKVLVLSGDVVLLSGETLQGLIQQHQESQAVCTLLTASLEDPTGYGRIVRDKSDAVVAIREEVDCEESERAILEVNAGVYCFESEPLLEALAEVSNDNAQGEYYLPDVVRVLLARQQKVAWVEVKDPSEILGINDRVDLAEAERELQMKVNISLMEQGVTLRDPEGTVIDPRCQFGSDVEIEGGTVLVNAKIGANVTIESGCRVVDSSIGDGVTLLQGCYIDESMIGDGCRLGPYAHLRPGNRLDKRVKIGNFVELKKSTLGEGTKASHLSYIGDAEIGKDVNLGCGFITCNYDGGPIKQKTSIEDGVFVGSDTQVVAPVKIGRGTYVASGTTITKDVPAGSLVISRGRQVNKLGFAKRLGKKES